MRERIKVPPAPVVIDYIYRPWLQEDVANAFLPLMNLNRAHVVMLANQGIISPSTAAALIRAIHETVVAGPTEIKWDFDLEEIYFNVEAHIIGKVGPIIGGQMHTGRSRNDLYAAMNRIFARNMLLKTAEWLHQLRGTLLDLAKAHAHTIVTGYTHMQPAQPTTLGHYFHGVANALERDDIRLQHAYESTNLCPLGACAFNGTGFPIDRHMLADLTGFAGLVENSIDAVGSRDYAPQVLAALAIMGINLSRLANDLHIWSSDEFSLVEVGDDFAVTSSIMPQKKNPFTFEHIRGKAGHIVGDLVGSLTAQKGVLFGHLQDICYESTYPLADGFSKAEAMLNLMASTLRSMNVNTDAAEARAADNFSTVTELADVMVREVGLSFRDAHAIVGAMVGELHEHGGRTDDVTLELLERIAHQRLGRPTGLSEASLKRALTPKENVAVRSMTGGPAPEESLRSIAASQSRFADQQAWWKAQEEKLSEARGRLEAAEAKLTQA